MSFGVSIFRDDFVFSSGHLMFYGDTEIEASHGHNYKVGVEIRGELDRNGMLVDFRDVKKSLKDEISKFNQKFIIPENSKLVLENAGEMLAVYYLGNKLIELKARETVIVPVSNTSSELLCRYLAERLIANFTNVEQSRFDSLSIFIEECYGQHARYTHEFKS